MARIHEVRWTDDEIAVLQVDDELLVCHLNCAQRGAVGYWMLTPLKGAAPGWWTCAGSGCRFELFNDGTSLNRAKIEGSTPKDIAWWVATWAGVESKDVQVSIDG